MLVIGLDAADPALIEKWSDEGILPTSFLEERTAGSLAPSSLSEMNKGNRQEKWTSSKYYVTTKRPKDTKDSEIITFQFFNFVLFATFVVKCLFRVFPLLKLFWIPIFEFRKHVFGEEIRFSNQ